MVFSDVEMRAGAASTLKAAVALHTDSFNGEPEALVFRAKSKSPTACR